MCQGAVTEPACCPSPARTCTTLRRCCTAALSTPSPCASSQDRRRTCREGTRMAGKTRTCFRFFVLSLPLGLLSHHSNLILEHHVRGNAHALEMKGLECGNENTATKSPTKAAVAPQEVLRPNSSRGDALRRDDRVVGRAARLEVQQRTRSRGWSRLGRRRPRRRRSRPRSWDFLQHRHRPPSRRWRRRHWGPPSRQWRRRHWGRRGGWRGGWGRRRRLPVGPEQASSPFHCAIQAARFSQSKCPSTLYRKLLETPSRLQRVSIRSVYGVGCFTVVGDIFSHA